MMNASELLAYANANNVDLSPYYDVNNPADTNWQDEVLRSGFSHNHNISINGGNEKTTYSASLNYIDREGVVRGTSMDRITARSFLQTKTLKDHLDLSVSVNASITNKQTASTENQGRSVLDAMYYYNPLVPVKNADGSWYANTSISQSYNPLSMVYEDQYKTKEKMLQGIAKATLHIIGRTRLVNAFFARARAYEAVSPRGLPGFLTYLDDALRAGRDLGSARTVGGGSVCASFRCTAPRDWNFRWCFCAGRGAGSTSPIPAAGWCGARAWACA